MNPPWSTKQQPPPPPQQPQAPAWQQYGHYAAPPSAAQPPPSSEQQYAAYYQHYESQTPEQRAYYQQYYAQQPQYGNPPAPGTEAAPGTTDYNYNYQHHNYYAHHQGYNQPPQQYQQHQQHQQQARPPPPPPPVNNGYIRPTYQPPPPAVKLPPWSTKRVAPEPPKVVYEQPAQPPPPPPPKVEVKTEAQKLEEKKAMSSESWPPSLQQYVQDVFANCLPNRRDQAETQLRNLILESHRAGTLLTTDWSEMSLPSACKQQPKKKKKGKKNAIQSQISQQAQKMQKLHQLHGSSPEEEAKRLRRLRRFEEDAAQFKADNVSTPMQQLHLDDNFNHTIVGTSIKLEKPYLRLTSAPDPATVRPLPILQRTLELLKDKWKNEQNYTYICDQFKSLRQDLTVQCIKNEFTVQVYEIHARIALEKSDLGEYNQCQTQLKGLYASGISGNVMEFTAYRILYFLHTQNWADVNATMAELTLEQKENPFVRHALDVRSSLATANFHRFFLLYRSAPNMGGYLMDQFVERERVQSMIILCKSCRPHLPLSFLVKELSFESEQELLKFLTEQGAHILKADDNSFLDTRAALIGLVESLKKYKKIDIKGQV